MTAHINESLLVLSFGLDGRPSAPQTEARRTGAARAVCFLHCVGSVAADRRNKIYVATAMLLIERR